MKIAKDIKAILFLVISTVIMFGIIITNKSPKKFEYPPFKTDVDHVIMLPSYVPEGYEVTNIDLSSPLLLVDYELDGELLCYVQIFGSSYTLSLDNEHSTITEYHSDHFDGLLLKDINIKDSHLLYVLDDKYSYEIFGIIEEEELFKMIESIEEYEPVK